jgi:hypothetical protein
MSPRLPQFKTLIPLASADANLDGAKLAAITFRCRPVSGNFGKMWVFALIVMLMS